MKDGHKSINEQLREARGVTVGGIETPEAHKALNAYIRRAAQKGTWEADLATGRITHIEGQPVN